MGKNERTHDGAGTHQKHATDPQPALTGAGALCLLDAGFESREDHPARVDRHASAVYPHSATRN